MIWHLSRNLFIESENDGGEDEEEQTAYKEVVLNFSDFEKR